MSSVFERDIREELLKSERVNDAFDYLVTQMNELMQMACLYRMRGIFDPVAMIEYAYKVELAILTSGHDGRVIQMCQSMLAMTNVSEHEFKISKEGKVKKRQVYFARRSDGLIKIGSSMNVKERLKQLSAGAGECLELIGHIDGSTLFEKAIHREFDSSHAHGEWFHPSAGLDVYIQGLMDTQQSKNDLEASRWPHDQ